MTTTTPHTGLLPVLLQNDYIEDYYQYYIQYYYQSYIQDYYQCQYITTTSPTYRTTTSPTYRTTTSLTTERLHKGLLPVLHIWLLPYLQHTWLLPVPHTGLLSVLLAHLLTCSLAHFWLTAWFRIFKRYHFSSQTLFVLLICTSKFIKICKLNVVGLLCFILNFQINDFETSITRFILVSFLYLHLSSCSCRNY